MRRRLIGVSWWFLAAAVLLVATPARGQPGRRAPYVRLFTGLGITGASDLRIHQPSLGTGLTFEQVSWEHKSLSTEWTRDSIPYVGARLGFFFREPRWLGVSVEVLHFNIFAEQDQLVRVRGVDEGHAVDTTAPFSQFVQGYQVSNGVNMVLGNLEAYRQLGRSTRFPDGRVDVYGGFGAGVTIPYTRSLIDGQFLRGYEWGRIATQLLGGLAWSLSPRWSTNSPRPRSMGASPEAIADRRCAPTIWSSGWAFNSSARFSDEARLGVLLRRSQPAWLLPGTVSEESSYGQAANADVSVIAAAGIPSGLKYDLV